MLECQCGFVDGDQGTGRQLLERLGPTVLVDIGFDPQYKPGHSKKPVASISSVEALVDTGASACFIDAMLAVDLKLPVVDRKSVVGIHGAQEVNVHVAQIVVRPLKFVMQGLFCAVDLSVGGQPHKALIGRTFLKHFSMTYDGQTGSVVIASR